MACISKVDWELLLTWEGALKNFYPRYSKRDIVKSLVLVNVPFMVPVLAFGPNEVRSFESFLLLNPHLSITSSLLGLHLCSHHHRTAAHCVCARFRVCTVVMLTTIASVCACFGGFSCVLRSFTNV